jgi:ketosteroid isomerase-like protein
MNLNPYHAVVERKLRRAFDRLGAGDYGSLFADFAPHIEHVFAGDHALGGARHSQQAYRQWFERLYRLLPGLHFEVRRLVVTGWPWDTLAVVEWIDRASPKDGEPYLNEGVHLMRLRWGRVVGIRVYLDTQRLNDTFQRLAHNGVEEAVAPPIVD